MFNVYEIELQVESFEWRRMHLQNPKAKKRIVQLLERGLGSITIVGLLLSITLTAKAQENIENITGSLNYKYSETQIESEETVDINLSETVFGQTYIEDVKTAIDTSAYIQEIEAQIIADKEKAAVIDAQKFYIPHIVLEYSWEEITMPYEIQKYVWQNCQELNLDYFLVMGVIARESRMNSKAVGYANGVYYYGYMQISANSAQGIQDILGVSGKDVTEPYDNIWLGTHLLAYCIEEIGTEYGGMMGYANGIQGYYDMVAVGQTTDSCTDRAYKYRRMLLQNERFTGTDLEDVQ